MRESGRLVVIGGVAAGMSAASRARRLRSDIEIVVLEKGEHVSYGACSLPYYLAGLVSREELFVYDVDFFRRDRRIDVRLGAEATALDPKRRTVTYAEMGGGEPLTLSYDALVIATGARPVELSVPGAGIPGVFTLRTLKHADGIKRYIDEARVERAAVVGAGYIGLEMAEALVARGLTVTVMEALPSILSTFDPDMSDLVEDELREKGVALHKNVKVEGFEPSGEYGRLGYVLARGQRVVADIVVLAVGVRPASELARSAGIELGKTGAMKVDARQVTSEPSVLAAGDCCEATHVLTRQPVWMPLGTTANKQGKIAGENAVGGSAQFGGVAGTTVAKIFDLQAARTGLSSEEAAGAGYRTDSVRIAAGSRSHAYPGGSRLSVKLIFDGRSGRLLGAQMIGREGAAKRIDTVAAAIHAGMTIRDLAQVDMSYAPPFAPVWDPLLVAATQALKKMVP
jgi:NADPH-dependent 2,4-dienoyl-CoA reductase/sulfur reductase-like enzyme